MPNDYPFWEYIQANGNGRSPYGRVIQSNLIRKYEQFLGNGIGVANLYEYKWRLRGLSEDEEELNPKLEEMIKTMTGVDLTDTNGQFRSTYDILLGISEVWDTLDTKQQALLLENIAGKTQV